MLVFKLVHGHVFYDGLAMDVPEGIAQASVILILVIAIIMAIPLRGIIFGQGKKPRSDRVIQFIRKYHGYVMSFGTVVNFHYHPTHANKSWVLLLETWVFIHGTLTAIIQPGIGWQIFSYGFMILFLVNQIFQTRASENKALMGLMYVLFCAWAYWGLNKDKVYYRATFIPIAEYACVYVVLLIGKVTCSVVDRLRNYKQLFVMTVYVCVTIMLSIGLAMILAGNLQVYNDY
ncbi:uncharacterized protein EV154DRAFT_421958 [Mucor mucedo]|uniref:uncharacterized protein n=1 Tax=Mucor mucedo TaxID=29922 RepID=UPI00221E6ADE|nr:uncharacterized protein EV154DRAFT_421958 [Mucor mucedo]KAI7890540.1 hypothetical protein EV154DRAFT_421958 [Mucor mucedo]